MSATHTYQATPRTGLGKHHVRKLRAGGLVPVTVSRSGKGSQHLALDTKQASHLAAHVVHLCHIEVDGNPFTALRGQVDRDCLSDAIRHIDLLLVDEKSEIKVDVAVVPDARECPGVKAGGIVEQRLRQVKVKCRADTIPDSIAIDLSEVQIMQSVTADKLKMPKGVTMITPPRTIVLSVVLPRGLKKAEDEAAAATTEGAAAAAAAPAAGEPGKEGAAAPAAAKDATTKDAAAKPAAGKDAKKK